MMSQLLPTLSHWKYSLLPSEPGDRIHVTCDSAVVYPPHESSVCHKMGRHPCQGIIPRWCKKEGKYV
jgi:hypothetical protein